MSLPETVDRVFKTSSQHKEFYRKNQWPEYIFTHEIAWIGISLI